MPKIYCPHCYKGVAYESAKPVVCGFCAKPYAEISNANIQVTPKTQPQVQIKTIDNNEDEIITVPQISKIEFAVDKRGLRPNTEVLGHISHTKSRPEILRPKIKTKKMSKQQIQQEWQKSFPSSKRGDVNSSEI